MTTQQSERGQRGPSHRDVVRRLGASQKSAKGAPAYSRFVNRPLGRQLAALAFRLGLTPNAVTVISACCTYTAIALTALVRPTGALGLLVGALLVLGYGLDAADGQLARLRGGGTASGEWLDHIVDAGKIATLHLAVLVGWYRFHPDWPEGWLLVPLAMTVASTVHFFGMLLGDLLRRTRASATATVDPGAPSTLRSLLVLPTDYGTMCVAFLLLGVSGVFRAVYALLVAATVAYTLLALVKWFGDMRALDRAAGR